MKLPRSYDIEIRSNGNEYGFMLQAKDGRKNWDVNDLSILPPSLITGSASYANIAPEQKILLEADDWRRGFQDELYETAKKYHKTTDCDARFKGRIMLSPKELTAISFDVVTSPTITNADMETESSGWTDATQTDAQHYEDSFSYDIDSTKYRAYQDLAGTPLGLAFTFKCYVYAGSVLGDIKLGIDDGVDAEALGDDISGAGEFFQLSVTKTLSTSATQLRIVIYRSNYNDDVYFDKATITVAVPTFGSTATQVDFGSDIVLASGAVLAKLDSGKFVAVAKFSKSITDLCVYKNKLYIALGWDDEFWYTSDLISFSESGLSNTNAKHMSNIENSQFWISDTANTLRDSATPDASGFSTEYTLPNSDYDITSLMNNLSASTVYVRKQDQTYYLSGSDVYTLIPDLSAEVNTSINYSIYPWKGNLYIPSGVNSFYEYDDGVVTTISPVRYAVGDTDFNEEILAIASDESYLYIVIENGDEVEILAGHWETIGSSTQWVWHPIYEKTTNDITSALISNVSGSKRLYLGTSSADDGIYNFIVPTSYSDVLKESGYEVKASGAFYTPWLTTNFSTMDKYWPKIRITSVNFNNDTTIRVHYQKKGDDDWTVLGYCKQGDYTSVADPWSFTYPDEITDSFDTGAVSGRIRFKFELATSTDELSPIIKKYSVECRLLPSMDGESTIQDEISMGVRVADDIVISNGVRQKVTATQILLDLLALRNKAEPFTLLGLDGISREVRFKPGGWHEQAWYDEKAKNAAFLVNCTLRSV